jgi:sensor c-di-GMP phosphodiesterase-like protein
MPKRRVRVIALGALLAVAGAIAPLAFMAYASWQIAIGKELDGLEDVGHRAIDRAQQTYAEAERVLSEMESSTLERCAPTHISVMRIMTLNNDAASEINYLENGIVKCTTWGRVTRIIHQPEVDYRTAEGIDVTFGVRPSDGIAKRMTALRMGSHMVLVPPARFTSIGIMPETSLALFGGEGHLASMRNEVDVDFARRHLTGEARGIDGGMMFVRVSADGVNAVVSHSINALHKGLMDELMLLLPVGLFISAFIVGIVIFMSKRRLSPRGELEMAVQKREFVVHYQPIIQLETNVCVGAEALVRWRRPDGSLVRPDLFIPLAEETGVIRQITDQVMDAIIRDLGPLLNKDRGLHIAINLCADDIKTGRFLDMFAEKLPQANIRNEQILLEATERGFIDVEAARKTLTRARAAGHTVAIDDFGTGYSSLQYLQGLPMDALKIDKSFVDTIGKGTATSSVTAHIIAMVKELGLLSVGEGIETEEQAKYLRERGVNFGQGWLFSKPLEAADFIAFQSASKREFGAAPEIIRAAA